MRSIAALAALVGAAAIAVAQPGTRNALVYGARAVGETAWNFGSFALSPLASDPTATFEVGIFAFRAQGAGMDAATFKVYIDNVSTAGDSVAFRGTAGLPDDGRIAPYNYLSSGSKVFANRNAAIPGTGFRIANAYGGPTGDGDTTDGAAKGGTWFLQAPPTISTDFHTADGELAYRFDLTIARPVGPAYNRTVGIHTPTGATNNRLQDFFTWNNLVSGQNTNFYPGSPNLPNAVVDSLQLSASWVPAPSVLTAVALAGIAASRRRRGAHGPVARLG